MSFADEIAAHDAAQGGGKSFADEIAEHEAGQGHDYAKIAGNVGAASGALAPYAAALSEGGLAGLGSSAIPITAGLAGSALAGAGTKALLDATNATPTLEKGAAYLRSGIKEPQHQSVGLNMAQNMFNEVTDPRAGLANLLTAAPDLASAYVASKAGPMAAELPGIIRNSRLGNSILGTPKVPTGQEGSAFLNAINKSMGVPEVPVQSKMEMGNLWQGIENTRNAVGNQQGQVKDFALANATPPDDVPGAITSSIKSALEALGVRPGKESISKNPEAAIQNVLKIAKEGAPISTDLQDMSNIQGKLAGMGRAARSPMSPTSNEAPVYEKTAQALQDKVMGSIPQGAPREALEKANLAYHTMLELEKMGYKMGTSGDFNPAKALSAWKEVTPADKARLDPDAVNALDELLKQKTAGLVGYVTNVAKKLPNVGPTVDAIMNPSKHPVRFNAPISPALSAPVQSALRYGGSASQAARRLSQVGAQ